jgi:hypothetical protein
MTGETEETVTLSSAAEKYASTVRRAIISRGALQTRLLAAFTHDLGYVDAERDLPPGLREEHAELIEQVTQLAHPDRDGRAEATFAQMSDQEASEVAERVIDLYHQIRGLYDAPMRTRADGSRVLGDMEAMILATEPEDEDGPVAN